MKNKARIFIRILFVSYLLCNFTNKAISQNKVFTPSLYNEQWSASALNNLESNFKKKITDLPSENKKDIEKIQTWKWENIAETFLRKEIYTEADAQKYLDDVVSEIVNNNQTLQNKPFRCYFSKSEVPNASFIGEGVILFNLGLLDKLENESQLAFILCHEIAHFYMNHLDNSINEYVATINSEEMQKELKKIKKKNYNKTEDLNKLVKQLSFSSGRHSRYKEAEADSLGVVFMKNTRFDISASLTSLALLDSIDNETYNMSETLQNTFNSADYPFQKKWLAKEEGLLGGHANIEIDKVLADSLKTHPDCKVRIRTLQPLVEKYKNKVAQKNLINKKLFAELQESSKYEVVQYAWDRKNYTKSLYLALSLLNSKPADPYLVAQTGRIFNGLYNELKQHTLGKVTDLPSPWYSAGYNTLLQFIQNLYRENYVQINYHFLQQYSPKLSFYKDFETVYEESSKLIQH